MTSLATVLAVGRQTHWLSLPSKKSAQRQYAIQDMLLSIINRRFAQISRKADKAEVFGFFLPEGEPEEESVCKKVLKSIRFETAPAEVQAGLLEPRKAEWGKFEQFSAAIPVLGEEKTRCLLQDTSRSRANGLIQTRTSSNEVDRTTCRSTQELTGFVRQFRRPARAAQRQSHRRKPHAPLDCVVGRLPRYPMKRSGHRPRLTKPPTGKHAGCSSSTLLSYFGTLDLARVLRAQNENLAAMDLLQ